MRRITLLLAAASVLTLTAAPAAFAQANDQNCADFASQADAQAQLRADPQDPDGLDARPGPADGNNQAGGDGIACESLPGPFDREPVFAGSPACQLPRQQHPRQPPSRDSHCPSPARATPSSRSGLGWLRSAPPSSPWPVTGPATRAGNAAPSLLALIERHTLGAPTWRPREPAGTSRHHLLERIVPPRTGIRL